MSVFQGEYDFDVPQFRLVLEPLMIAGAAGIALVAARLFMGRGGALAAVAFFLVIRGGIALIVGPAFGEITPSFPLYLGSAVIVELLALSVPLARRPLAFGTVAGVLIGTVGHATEWGWTQFTQTLSWDSDILVEGTLMAIVGGVVGGLLGALLAAGLRRRLPRPAVARAVVVGSLVVLAAAVANGLTATVPDDLEATFGIEDVQTDPRTANVTVQLNPADFTDDPAWVQITSWQGDGLGVTPLERTGEGTSHRRSDPARFPRRPRLGAAPRGAGRRPGRHPARAPGRGRLRDPRAGAVPGHGEDAAADPRRRGPHRRADLPAAGRRP